MAFAAPLIPLAIGAASAAAAGGSLATALGVGSALMTGFSGFQQGQYQSAVANQNAKLSAQNADRAAEAAQIEQMRSDREYAGQLSQAFAAQSVSGFDVLSQSQVLARQNIQRVRGLAALDIRKQGTEASNKLFQESANFRSQASAAHAKALMDLATGVLSAGTTASKDPNISKKVGSLIGSARSLF